MVNSEKNEDTLHFFTRKKYEFSLWAVREINDQVICRLTFRATRHNL